MPGAVSFSFYQLLSSFGRLEREELQMLWRKPWRAYIRIQPLLLTCLLLWEYIPLISPIVSCKSRQVLIGASIQEQIGNGMIKIRQMDNSPMKYSSNIKKTAFLNAFKIYRYFGIKLMNLKMFAACK